ncbi:ABC transporter ATP-binding protein [Anaerobacillus sp. MEB173]|uniref:ABC transporter ATP-binding protein n=1 Tax=Anaerobacillus sp. MEB173 TaxID=3383345 RepID=UPI003F8FD955
MLRVENISKEYKIDRERKVVAIKDVSLTIQKGQFVSITGPSGSGKSTLLATMGLLAKPTAGEVFYDGTSTSSLKDRDRTRFRYQCNGFVYQFASLIPTLSAYENILLPVSLEEKKVTIRHQKRADELLEMVGLIEQREHLPSQLSGGEQRRVALARALMNEPPCLFADEPTAALDRDSANRIFSMMKQLQQKGTTIIMVTHDNELARRTDNMIKISNGTVVTE